MTKKTKSYGCGGGGAFTIRLEQTHISITIAEAKQLLSVLYDAGYNARVLCDPNEAQDIEEMHKLIKSLLPK